MLGLMLVLKLAMFACGASFGDWATPSPSGHTATAAVVYGGLVALAVRRRMAGIWVALAAAVMAAGVVGLTRVELGVHSLGDVAVGAAVGVAGAVALRWAAGVRPGLVAGPRLAGVVVLAVVVFHGQRLQAEVAIRGWALEVWPLTLCTR